jgi:hypothetical protein
MSNNDFKDLLWPTDKAAARNYYKTAVFMAFQASYGADVTTYTKTAAQLQAANQERPSIVITPILPIDLNVNATETSRVAAHNAILREANKEATTLVTALAKVCIYMYMCISRHNISYNIL